MKKSNYILLPIGVVIILIGIFIFDQVNIATMLLSVFTGLLFLAGGVGVIMGNKKKNERKLAYVRAK
jgi:uncharacterized membrane protein HdeD (DUF308 family)